MLMRKEECRRMANILNRLGEWIRHPALISRQMWIWKINMLCWIFQKLSGDLLLGMFVALDFVWTQKQRKTGQ